MSKPCNSIFSKPPRRRTKDRMAVTCVGTEVILPYTSSHCALDKGASYLGFRAPLSAVSLFALCGTSAPGYQDSFVAVGGRPCERLRQTAVRASQLVFVTKA